MNLRSFHLVFIACATLLAMWFGAWILSSGSLTGAARFAAGIGAFAVAAGLVLYEAWFVRYSKRAP